MTIWYKAVFGRIEEVEVVRETEKFIVLSNGRREAINTDWYWYRKDREQAKQAMIEDAEKERDKVLRNLEFAEQKISEAQNA